MNNEIKAGELIYRVTCEENKFSNMNATNLKEISIGVAISYTKESSASE